MLSFLAGLFSSFVGFIQELTKTLIIDTIIGLVLRPIGL